MLGYGFAIFIDFDNKWIDKIQTFGIDLNLNSSHQTLYKFIGSNIQKT